MATAERIFAAIKEFFVVYFFESIKSIGIKDVIDILLLALVLFFIYRLIRDSRAWKLLIGLGVLFVVSLAARAFEMNALNFIFGNFQQIGILAIIILFRQPSQASYEAQAGTGLL